MMLKREAVNREGNKCGRFYKINTADARNIDIYDSQRIAHFD